MWTNRTATIDYFHPIAFLLERWPPMKSDEAGEKGESNKEVEGERASSSVLNIMRREEKRGRNIFRKSETYE
jgi:hypothetical protein